MDGQRHLPRPKVGHMGRLCAMKGAALAKLSALLKQLLLGFSPCGDHFASVECCILTLNRLRLKIELLLDSTNLYRTVYTWPSRVPASFLKPLNNEEPAALSGYAQWLVFVILLEDTWWTGDLGRATIARILDVRRKDQDVSRSGNRESKQFPYFDWDEAMA